MTVTSSVAGINQEGGRGGGHIACLLPNTGARARTPDRQKLRSLWELDGRSSEEKSIGVESLSCRQQRKERGEREPQYWSPDSSLVKGQCADDPYVAM